MYECVPVYQVWKTVVVLECVGACLHECVYLNPLPFVCETTVFNPVLLVVC